MAFCLAWGSLLWLWFRPGALSWDRLANLPRSLQDTYTIGLYLAVPFALTWFWKGLERRPLRDLGLRFVGGDALQGLILGAGCIVTTYGVASVLGWTVWQDPGPWPWRDTALCLVAAATMAPIEELLFRGMILRSLLRDLPPAWAVLVSAAIFALAHLFRTGLTPYDAWTSFGGLLVTGVLLGYAAYSRSLWLSVGLHAPWIFFIGLSSQHNLWNYLPSGVLWTGAGYPPRGFLTILAMLAALTWLVGDRRQGIAPSKRA